METTKKKVGPTADRAIVAERIYDAPRELVYKMWTDPVHIGNWWGPNGFTTTIHKMDVRPGGIWEFVMRGPDGTDYKNKIVYNEVSRPERLIYDHVSGPLFQMRVTFEDLGARTRVSVQMLFNTAEERSHAESTYGAVEGLNQTLNRLGEQLSRM